MKNDQANNIPGKTVLRRMFRAAALMCHCIIADAADGASEGYFWARPVTGVVMGASPKDMPFTGGDPLARRIIPRIIVGVAMTAVTSHPLIGLFVGASSGVCMKLTLGAIYGSVGLVAGAIGGTVRGTIAVCTDDYTPS